MTEELVRYTISAGSELTPEQKARIREAAKHPIVFDEDCPELTDEQLAEFRPVNFATMEERYQAMVEMGLVTKEQNEPVLAGK